MIAVVVHIIKQGKNQDVSVKYRPIALTSCSCKLFERIINERLVVYLDMNNTFRNIQCGG